MQSLVSGIPRWAARLAVLVIVLGLAGCSQTLNMDGTKTAVTSGLTEKLGLTIASITCPENRQAAAGDTFECKVVPDSGGELVVKVTQKDDQGNISWELTNTTNLIQLGLLAEHITKGMKEQMGMDAAVDCGGKYRVAVAGKTFECTATMALGRQARVTVTMKDDQGQVSWDVKAPTP